MLNFQGELSFDSSMLKKTNSYLVAPATYSSIINNNLNDRVVFNGSDLSGYDFSSPGYEFLVVEYEVLKTGTTEPAFGMTRMLLPESSARASSEGTSP